MACVHPLLIYGKKRKRALTVVIRSATVDVGADVKAVGSAPSRMLQLSRAVVGAGHVSSGAPPTAGGARAPRVGVGGP